MSVSFIPSQFSGNGKVNWRRYGGTWVVHHRHDHWYIREISNHKDNGINDGNKYTVELSELYLDLISEEKVNNTLRFKGLDKEDWNNAKQWERVLWLYQYGCADLVHSISGNNYGHLFNEVWSYTLSSLTYEQEQFLRMLSVDDTTKEAIKAQLIAANEAAKTKTINKKEYTIKPLVLVNEILTIDTTIRPVIELIALSCEYLLPGALESAKEKYSRYFDEYSDNQVNFMHIIAATNIKDWNAQRDIKGKMRAFLNTLNLNYVPPTDKVTEVVDENEDDYEDDHPGDWEDDDELPEDFIEDVPDEQ
ncbi:hypothetical protein [Nostoc sp. 106C]|uniref:hypothetical protein n=1 Tax=Nostoc sp. 106C TaxID=1932667 RepID=UPI000A3AEA12|nr:hypothetical protein [Nostoc sp. 106C]OUL17831.1 hypothetical protein BV375_34930 [Nostoc sp. 106C]